MKGNKGFTILEMIIVMVIIAALTTIAVPSIISWRANSSLSGDTRTLKADFELAKSRAIRDNTIVTIRFNTANNSYLIENPARTLLTRNLAATNITDTTFAGDIVSFNARGLPLTPGDIGDVTLTNGSRNTRVSITNLIGSIRIN